ncbi:hypothetical protein [Rhodovulum marinum]|uniref:Uncharacterized protein n=1 Tax=Rhodovulum marinum TaxID=320662 RepID=A0A4V2SQM9_9RHOB|nr:hypothetical protein [Rhodovulum marinum]TCP39606.1 hypothetical protein EV662_11186 [Rhodovulum marinum]
MSDRELRINVYNSSKIGHANVSFYRQGQHEYTIGANIRLEVPQLAIPKVAPFEPDDGIYRDESAFHLAAMATGDVTSAGVPVTDLEYDRLLGEARALENQTYNYSVLTEACVELVSDFYDKSGHPGAFGDLFPADARTGSLVWSRVPVTDHNPFSTWPSDRPYYVAPEPYMLDPPPPPDPVIYGDLPDPLAPEPEKTASTGDAVIPTDADPGASEPEVGAAALDDLFAPARTYEAANPSPELSFGTAFDAVERAEDSFVDLGDVDLAFSAFGGDADSSEPAAGAAPDRGSGEDGGAVRDSGGDSPSTSNAADTAPEVPDHGADTGFSASDLSADLSFGDAFGPSKTVSALSEPSEPLGFSSDYGSSSGYSGGFDLADAFDFF